MKIINKSSDELAAAMLIDEYIIKEIIKYSNDDLIRYYDSNSNYFRLRTDSYLLNKVTFIDEDKAIKFRLLALDSDWKKAVSVFINDSQMVKNTASDLVEEGDIYPSQLSRIIKDFYPEEISIVIPEKPGYYSVVTIVG